VLDLVRISRPGWWLVSVWLYVSPTGGKWAVFDSPMFWIGLVYVVFPINVLVYGVNDYTDVKIDKDNDRKGNFFFGAKCSPAQLRSLPTIIVLIVAMPLFCLIVPMVAKFYVSKYIELLPWYMLWLILAVGVNLVYNVEPLRLSSNGPFEIPTVIFGQSLVTIFSCMVNDLSLPPLRYWVHLCFLVGRTQLWTEVCN
jgi:4-hydroxybenzoate polyprenyltransferase